MKKCLVPGSAQIPPLVQHKKKRTPLRACARGLAHQNPTTKTTSKRGEVTRARVRWTDEPNRPGGVGRGVLN